MGDTSSLSAKEYTLAARVLNPNATSSAWKGARFQFDGKDLSPDPNGWQMTESVTPKELEQPNHTFCVFVGTPSSAADKNQLQVRFGLWRDGSDAVERELSTIDKDLLVSASIAAPDLKQIWAPWLLLLLSALLAWLLLLFLRSRMALPSDLEVALQAANGTPPAPTTETKSIASGFFDVSQERPLLSIRGDCEIGRVKPIADRLFVFQPAEGYRTVSVETVDGWTPLVLEADGSVLLMAGITYQAGSQDDCHQFRINYSDRRPVV